MFLQHPGEVVDSMGTDSHWLWWTMLMRLNSLPCPSFFLSFFHSFIYSFTAIEQSSVQNEFKSAVCINEFIMYDLVDKYYFSHNMI